MGINIEKRGLGTGKIFRIKNKYKYLETRKFYIRLGRIENYWKKEKTIKSKIKTER